MSKTAPRSKPQGPSVLDGLPHFSFTSEPPRTREQALREDVAYEITSLDQLLEEANRRFDSSK